MSKKKTQVTNAMRMLSAASVSFDVVEYEAEEVTKDFGMYISSLTGIAPEQSFKTLVGKGDKTGYIVCCIPVDKELDLKKAAKASGNKSVELVAVKDLLSVTGYIRGGVSPIGMKKKFPTFIHSSAAQYDIIGISGGVCGITLKLSPQDLAEITQGEFNEITMTT